MQERDNLLMRERGLGLAEAGGDESGLAGDRQRLESLSLEQALGTDEEVCGQLNVALEAAREYFALDRVAKHLLRSRHPDAAPGQLALEIRHRLARGPDNETDQIRNRPHRARHHAQAFKFARTRSVVEFAVVRLCGHARIRLLFTAVLRRPEPLPP